VIDKPFHPHVRAEAIRGWNLASSFKATKALSNLADVSRPRCRLDRAGSPALGSTSHQVQRKRTLAGLTPACSARKGINPDHAVALFGRSSPWAPPALLPEPDFETSSHPRTPWPQAAWPVVAGPEGTGAGGLRVHEVAENAISIRPGGTHRRCLRTQS